MDEKEAKTIKKYWIVLTVVKFHFGKSQFWSRIPIKIQFYTTECWIFLRIGKNVIIKTVLPRNWTKRFIVFSMNYYIPNVRTWLVMFRLKCPKKIWTHHSTAWDFELRWEKSFWLNEMIILLGVTYSMGLCNPQITGSNYFSKWKWFKIKFEKINQVKHPK